MTIANMGDPTYRAEILMRLRDGTRQSMRLAEQLSADGLVGHEAQGLLIKLQAIRAELDAMPITIPDLRPAQNDPLWQDSPFPFRRIRAD